MKISVLFFSAAATGDATDRYRLLRDAVTTVDDSAVGAVWLPERHFTDFGGLYPNPAVLAAAVAAMTSRLRIRAGSVIVPLHDPVRVAEEWSVVDNLSGGRAEVSFGSGWNVNDFVLAPANYERRRELMWEQIDTVCRLWRGEPVARRNGAGQEVKVSSLPAPVQPELPVWITAQSEGTFARAGAAGIPVLTNLNFSTPANLVALTATYRDHRATAASTDRAGVAVMTHTYLADDVATARRHATPALRGYLESNLTMRAEFAEGKSPGGAAAVSADQRRSIVDRGVDRILDWAGLVGDRDSAVERIRELERDGVDELACLVDFGVDHEHTVRSLELLCDVAERVA
jgi:natural product biosynthesis luciferase-like monooxygenase protein